MGWTAIRGAILLIALAPLVYYLVAIVAALRFFRPGVLPKREFAPPVSILKPVQGLDRESYENYASLVHQDYPEFEVLFCVSDERDSAIPIIEQIQRDFPGRRVRLLIGATAQGANDKVNKLCRLAREARHDLLVMSDSDIRVEAGYLKSVARPFRSSRVGCVTCLYRGLTDGSLAASLEALGNSTDFAAAVLVTWLAGRVDFALGATMATTKKFLADIGGFEAIADYLADDFELGNRIARRGYRVELADSPVSVVYPRESFSEAFRHQVRWNSTIRYCRPAGYSGMILGQGLPWAIAAALVARSAPLSMAYLFAYTALRGAVAWIVGVQGMKDELVRRKMWLIPLRDAFAFVVWLRSFFPQRIRWRGREFLVRDKRLVAAEPSRRG